MPHKSFFCPQCNPFSLQKWNALGPTIPKWCNTCILEARKGGYQIGAWVPAGGQMTPCWYPPFRTSNIQVLHHFGIVRPRAFHFWRENRRVRGIKKEFRWHQYSVIGHFWPPENWFLPPFTPVFSSEMECCRSHDSEMEQWRFPLGFYLLLLLLLRAHGSWHCCGPKTHLHRYPRAIILITCKAQDVGMVQSATKTCKITTPCFGKSWGIHHI